MSVNRVTLVGHLGNDPDLRHTDGGTAVANFSLATNERWKDKSGEQKEHTEWHRIVAWGKTAELCKEYLHKGSQVYIEGKLQTRSYQDKDGVTKYTTEVVVNQVQFLGKKEGGGGRAPHPAESQGGRNQAPAGSMDEEDVPL